MIAWLPPTQRPEPGTLIIMRHGGAGITLTLSTGYVWADGTIESDRGETYELNQLSGWVPAADLLALPVLS